MSWEVQGTVYHDPTAYRAAQARANEESVARRSERLAREIAQIRARITTRAESLSRGGLNVEQRQRLQEEHRTDTQRLQAIEREVTNESSRMQLEMAKQAAEFAAHASAMGLSIEDLRGEQARHVATIQTRLTETSKAVAEAARQAEVARAEGERRLQEQIQAVDDRLAAERRAKESDAKTSVARVKTRCDLIAEGLAPLADLELEVLGLSSEKERCRQSVAAARRLADGGNPEAGLAMAESSAVALVSLEREISRRKAALAVRRDSYESRLQGAVARLDDQNLKHWFGVEGAALSKAATRLLGQLADKYTRYEQLEAQSLHDEGIIREIETQASAMLAAVPALEAMEPERCSNEEAMLALLKRRYGPLSEINAEDTYVRPGDPKSSRRWSLSYGGARVVLEVGLHGAVRIDGYGHQSNQACADRAAEVVADMRDTGSVSQATVDGTNRSQERRAQTLQEASEVMQAVDRLSARIG
jgi:hypothetical protein